MNNKDLINLNTLRAHEARVAKRLSGIPYHALLIAGIVGLIVTAALQIKAQLRWGLIALSPSLICLMIAAWWKRYLSVLPGSGREVADRLSGSVLA
ncbi:MAG: hypothetical protein ACREHG_08990, partial [Candidatus Saccharimonadales bacterium]